MAPGTNTERRMQWRGPPVRGTCTSEARAPMPEPAAVSRETAESGSDGSLTARTTESPRWPATLNTYADLEAARRSAGACRRSSASLPALHANNIFIDAFTCRYEYFIRMWVQSSHMVPEDCRVAFEFNGAQHHRATELHGQETVDMPGRAGAGSGGPGHAPLRKPMAYPRRAKDFDGVLSLGPAERSSAIWCHVGAVYSGWAVAMAPSMRAFSDF